MALSRPRKGKKERASQKQLLPLYLPCSSLTVAPSPRIGWVISAPWTHHWATLPLRGGYDGHLEPEHSFHFLFFHLWHLLGLLNLRIGIFYQFWKIVRHSLQIIPLSPSLLIFLPELQLNVYGPSHFIFPVPEPLFHNFHLFVFLCYHWDNFFWPIFQFTYSLFAYI